MQEGRPNERAALERRGQKGVVAKGEGLDRKKARAKGAGPRPRLGRTAPVPVYCWTPEKAGWRVSATVGL